MRFVIRHEGKNRLRVHMKQSRMTYEQADVLLYYLEGMEEVVRGLGCGDDEQVSDRVLEGEGSDRRGVLDEVESVDEPLGDTWPTHNGYGRHRLYRS